MAPTGDRRRAGPRKKSRHEEGVQEVKVSRETQLLIESTVLELRDNEIGPEGVKTDSL